MTEARPREPGGRWEERAAWCPARPGLGAPQLPGHGPPRGTGPRDSGRPVCPLRAAGNSSECPPPGDAADDTVCLDLGKCKDGKCVPFCEREQRLESCACNGEHMALPILAAGGVRRRTAASGSRSFHGRLRKPSCPSPSWLCFQTVRPLGGETRGDCGRAGGWRSVLTPPPAGLELWCGPGPTRRGPGPGPPSVGTSAGPAAAAPCQTPGAGASQPRPLGPLSSDFHTVFGTFGSEEGPEGLAGL